MEVTVDLKTIINKLQATFDRIQKLEEKNEKLVEALKFYADLNDEVVMYDSMGVTEARQVLEEIGRKW